MAESRLTVFLDDERSTAALAASLCASLSAEVRAAGDGLLVELKGPLGAGKTTFVRGFLRAAGISGPVTSPTYTLIEPYQVDDLQVYHVDFYRLSGAADQAGVGFEELRRPQTLLLVEWPERLPGVLGPVSLEIELAYDGVGRRATLSALDPAGTRVLTGVSSALPPEPT